MPAVLQSFAALRLFFKHAGKLRQFLAQRLECGGEFLEILRRSRGHPAFLLEHQTQVARGLVQFVAGFGQRRKILGGGQRFDSGILSQIQQLRGGQTLAEEQAGGFRQLMRLVEYHSVAGGQQFRNAFVAQHHIGEKQVVIDHHDIGFHRLGTGMEHETFLVVRAFLAQAVFTRRGDLQPDRRVFRHLGNKALVSRIAHLGVFLDFSQMFDVFARRKTAIGQGVFQMIVTHVIGTSLEQGD